MRTSNASPRGCFSFRNSFANQSIGFKCFVIGTSALAPASLHQPNKVNAARPCSSTRFRGLIRRRCWTAYASRLPRVFCYFAARCTTREDATRGATAFCTVSPPSLPLSSHSMRNGPAVAAQQVGSRSSSSRDRILPMAASFRRGRNAPVYMGVGAR